MRLTQRIPLSFDAASSSVWDSDLVMQGYAHSGRRHGRVEEGVVEARTGLAPTASGHAARDLQGEIPRTRGIPCDNAERTERNQREGGRPQD